MSWRWLAGGLLVLAGCAEPPATPAAPRSIAAEPVGGDGLWLELPARAEHLAPVGHGSAMAWAPAGWVAPDGGAVRVGDELLRYDVEALRESDARDAFSLERDAKRRELDMLRAQGEIIELEGRIRQLRARRAVVAAELAAASEVDAEVVRIAQLQVADAVAEHAAAVRRCEALERIAAAGAPVSGAELARAREDEVRTRAARAAPEVNLELARLPAARSTVRRLELTLADIDVQLGGGPEEGLAAQLRTAVERQARRQLDRERGRGEWRLRRHQETLKVLEDPAIRARTAGIVQLRDAEVRPGTKLPRDASIIFVLGPDGLAARIAVPERLRPLVTEGARIALRSPAFAGVDVLGRIESVAAAPETGDDGQRVFPAIASLRQPPPGLRPGMASTCRLAVDAAAGAAVIPSFCLLDRLAPEVELAAGGRRRLAGWMVGGSFLVVTGLAPGERVLVPGGTAGAGKVRISALVEPADFVPVRLRSWDWEVLEVLPEGVAVRAGQRIASLVKVAWWRSADQIRSEAEVNLAQARLDLAIAQLSATDDRAAARGEWVRAQLARERAELEAWVGRNAYDAVAEARAEAGHAAAVVARDRAARELAAAVEERAAGGISDNRLRLARRSLESADAALDRARLDRAERQLATDWLSLRELDAAVLDAADQESSRRQQAILAGESFRARLAGAAARFDGTRRWVDGELRNLADEEVLAPVDGRLVYAASWAGPPRPGRRLESWEPFRIAAGDGRRATFEVPARLFGRVAAGTVVRLSGPGAEDGIDATVVTVANAFLPPGSFADEIALGRTLGVEERIFQVTVAFTPRSPGQLPPGSTVHAAF